MPTPRSRKIKSITPVGHVLVEQELISPAILTEALDIQRQTGERIGRILMTEGHITAFKLHQAIANHYDLPFVNLHDTPADATLHHVIDVPEYIRFQVIPFKEEGGRTILATADPSAALVAWAEERYGKNYAFVITSPFDIYWHIDSYFADNLDTISRNRLWEIMPEKSARIVLTRAQQLQLLTVILAMVILVTLFPNGFTASLLLLINFFYFITIVLKCMLFYIGWDYRPGSVLPSKKLPPMDESTLPVYTLLIPVYDEVAALPRLIESLNALDYPKAKLDIKFIVERDDEKTIHAFKSLKPSGQYELIYVPYSLPQTKPKACNYALHFARGKYVTIYDAEDSPDPLQLKKAVHWFAQQPENVICLQARLNYYNRNHNLLTRLFAIEYAAWFDFMLPGLRKLRIPIPLGGTSNHLHLEKLRNLGEWDPYNVTEDADLGIRLALQGYETDMLDSLTAEEAPIGLKAWMNQRTRWVRGYMQTWLVHMRHPVRLFRELDYNAFWGFQFFIGGPCLVFLSAPLLWIFSILWFAGVIDINAPTLNSIIGKIALFNLFFGLLAHMFFALHIVMRYRWKGMSLALLAFPVYWLLHSVASFKALYQLIKNPHFWEKTPHGLSKVSLIEAEQSLKTMR